VREGGVASKGELSQDTGEDPGMSTQPAGPKKLSTASRIKKKPSTSGLDKGQSDDHASSKTASGETKRGGTKRD
jgi:hypothetical protein